MSKTIIMNVTLALLQEEQVQDLLKIATIKYLEDSFYIAIEQEN